MPRASKRTLVVGLSALLLFSGVQAEGDGVDVTSEDSSVHIASMNHVQFGLNAASQDIPRLHTTGTSTDGNRQQAALGAVRSNLGAHPDFQEFIHKHKGVDHTYCPNQGPDEPCIEALRRYVALGDPQAHPNSLARQRRNTQSLRVQYFETESLSIVPVNFPRGFKFKALFNFRLTNFSIQNHLRRELSFLENQAIIEAHNAKSGSTFKMKQTPFADYSASEFKHEVLKYSGKRTLSEKRAEREKRDFAKKFTVDLGVKPSGHLGRQDFPANFDWAEQAEVMGKIHTQKTSCASCWAYTSTDTIEAQAVISGRRAKHVELSAEQLINCDGYDSGCNTGNMFTAYEWIHENGGLATARAFHGAAAVASAGRAAAFDSTASALGSGEQDSNLGKYQETSLGAEDERRELDAIESSLGSSNGNCPTNLQLMDRVFGYCELDFEAGEDALMAAVARHPVAVGINANKVFQLYASGIISSKDCGPAPHTQDAEIMAINHAVVVTGWGEETIGGKQIKYWVLKNSFGDGWGDGGYFKLERGQHTLDDEGFGTCGLFFESVYPVMEESAGAGACVKGSTFRTKYYSAASAAGLGAVNDVIESMRDSLIGTGGHRGASFGLVGLGFAGGVVAVVLAVSASRLERWSKRASQEGAREGAERIPLIPQ